jgi:hypothetical protein
VGDLIASLMRYAEIQALKISTHRAPAKSSSGGCSSGYSNQTELAGHQDLATTQRDMHVSPAAIEDAIRLLDAPGGWSTLSERLL